MSTMPVGRIRHHYAHLIQEICLQYFLRPNSERTCSNVRNDRIVSCFCNGEHAHVFFHVSILWSLL